MAPSGAPRPRPAGGRAAREGRWAWPVCVRSGVCVRAHGQNPTSAVLGPTLGSGETWELAHGAGSRVVSGLGGWKSRQTG